MSQAYASELGTLTIGLPNKVSARDLARLTMVVHDTYFSSFFLELAENTPGGPFDEHWWPTPDGNPTNDQDLWIQRLEIGTPNLIMFLGQLTHLVIVHGILNDIWRALGENSHQIAAIGYITKTVLDIWQRSRLGLKATELASNGKITKGAADKKNTPPPDRSLISALKLAPPGNMTLSR
jgi:hypothetical protein